MREVSVAWTRESLSKTDLSELDDVVHQLTFLANLLITPEGVRQIVLPTYSQRQHEWRCCGDAGKADQSLGKRGVGEDGNDGWPFWFHSSSSSSLAAMV